MNHILFLETHFVHARCVELTCKNIGESEFDRKDMNPAVIQTGRGLTQNNFSVFSISDTTNACV